MTIDNRILLKAIPVVHWGAYTVLMERNPAAVCPEDMDMGMLQELMWCLRGVIELAVVEEVRMGSKKYLF